MGTFQEKDRLLQEARNRREKEKSDAKNAQDALNKKREDAETKRQGYFSQLAARIKMKDDTWLKKVLEKKAEMKRAQKVQRERNQEYIKELFNDRQPIFEKQLKRTEERKLAREAEEEAVRKYHEMRSLPKKEKTKGKHKKKKEGEDDPKAAKPKKKPKAKEDKDKDK